MKDIVIYTTQVCPYCIKAKELFNLKKMKYKELRVDEDPKLMQEAIKKSNGMQTVPQIFIGDFHVGGCDDLYALEEDGKLDDIVKS